MSKNIIIIGSGIAGLSSGCYAQMNGYNTHIVEQHSLPGGLCTAWERNGYKIDGCIHWLVGSSPESSFYKYWEELHALKETEIVQHEIFTTIETGTPEDKKIFTVYTNADRLNANMKKIAPEDTAEIDTFTALIKKFSSFEIITDTPPELMGLGDFFNMMKMMKPYMREFRQYRKLTIKDYAERFSNSHLREGITAILDMPDFSFMVLLFMLGWQHAKKAGYPIGGSLPFARRIENRYLSLGGSIQYNSRVKRILTRKNRAVGVELDSGQKQYADIIISAADGYSTIYSMLDGKYTNKKIDRMYERLPLFQPFFMLSLGVRRDFSSQPPMIVRLLDSPIVLEGKTHHKIGFQHYCHDPSLAPDGASLLEIMYTSDYDYWKNCAQTPDLYRKNKAAIAETLIGCLENYYPGIRKEIEMIDTATPMTFERYTSNRNGTYEGWLLTPKTLTMRIKKTLPGLKNFYMAGQWVQPGGGLPSVVKSGRDLISLLCHKDKKILKISPS
ncbi:MAG: NAD(P)/FAD-dependent oxidoreductase [Spirochaetes bacterium]|jgi:phytoene dehydrogenase-like protein|nr:NAD(P)/FAD-dependent oxidoreductase [Spirochaetota bacterium]